MFVTTTIIGPFPLGHKTCTNNVIPRNTINIFGNGNSNPTKLIANCFLGERDLFCIRGQIPYILIHCRCTIMSMVSHRLDIAFSHLHSIWKQILKCATVKTLFERVQSCSSVNILTVKTLFERVRCCSSFNIL